MRSLAVFILVVASSPTLLSEDYYPSMGKHKTIDEVDRSKYYEYKDRLKERRIYALETRRQLNAGKVHRYWTAIRVPVNYGVYFPRLYRYGYYNRYNGYNRNNYSDADVNVNIYLDRN